MTSTNAFAPPTSDVGCVIFDCDGTLVDSEVLCNQALAQVLAARGIEEDPHDLVRRYRGGRLASILAEIEVAHQVRFLPDLEAEYRLLVVRMLDEHLQPIQGVQSALERIRAPKCVASGGPMEKIRQSLRICRLAHHFGDDVFSSYVVESWKPDPGLFLFAAQQMGVPPQRCAVIEDTFIGVRAAVAAGMRVYFYDPGGVRSSGLPPEAVMFEDMHRLPALLESREDVGG